jgi:stage II sporulation protein D
MLKKAFYKFLPSFKIWHIAPLCLPLLLGSAAVRHLPISAPAADAPPATEKGLARDFLLSQPTELPSRTLAALGSQKLPQQPVFSRGRSADQQRSEAQKRALQPLVSQTKAAPQSTPRNAMTRPKPPAEAAIRMAAAPQPARNLPPIPLRVAIVRDAKMLSVGTSDAGAVATTEGTVIGQFSANAAVPVTVGGAGLQVGQWQAPTAVWVKPRAANGFVAIDGRWYRGAVLLVARPEGLLAVNYVDLESYLYSVVGAEMPASWPIEALKAQAIAARSYAIVHIARPANDLYDLGATPRWQAYSGTESETDATQRAVEATRGILLSYKGGVVESLYASSIDLVRDVHGGFGMSQHGANKLAQQSYSYPQILNHFYPGTGLAVLSLK